MSQKIVLTGNQVRFIRGRLPEGIKLGWSSYVMAEHFSVSQPTIIRLEQRGSDELDGPLIILIKQLADEFDIKILPDHELVAAQNGEAA